MTGDATSDGRYVFHDAAGTSTLATIHANAPTSDFELAETRIPNKYEELIGLGVSGATRCKYCALFHTEAARLYGATDDEIAEASMMGGVTMMASTFINAQQLDYERFRKETLDIVAYVKKEQSKKAT